MAQRIEFHGRYRFANQKRPEIRKANQNDPRHIFYEAMFRHNTFEAYEADVGEKTVLIRTSTGTRPVSGHDEIRYAVRDRKWIKGEP
jgi:hypothetical protein